MTSSLAGLILWDFSNEVAPAKTEKETITDLILHFLSQGGLITVFQELPPSKGLRGHWLPRGDEAQVWILVGHPSRKTQASLLQTLDTLSGWRPWRECPATMSSSSYSTLNNGDASAQCSLTDTSLSP